MLVHFVTAVLSFVIVSVPATLGGLFFLDPILRKRKSAEAGGKSGEVSRKDEKGFIRLDLNRDAVPADGPDCQTETDRRTAPGRRHGIG